MRITLDLQRRRRSTLHGLDGLDEV